MDQESFRRLLATPRPGSSSSLTPSRAGGQSSQKTTLTSNQPAFQPRKIKKKKNESDYRDRASERRAGINDYAQVESVLEDFEQRTAAIEDREVVEEQRKYLGGDTEHTILVKGLDFALLEQNKARAVASGEDDDTLEAAFQAAQSTTTVLPMKRTRGDLIRELKEKRTSGGAKAHSEGPSTDVAFEQAKKTGKFKPIGVSESTKAIEKNNKTKGKGQEKLAEGERKKKRRKVGPESMIAKDQSHSVQSTKTLNMLAAQLPEAATTSPEAPEVDTSRQKTTGPLVENYDGVDIFADAGEYEGVDFGDEEGEELPDNARATEPVVDPSGSGVPVVKGWFEDDPVSIPSASAARLPTPPPAEPIPGENKELNQEQVTRLAPLASSALPSISDFLAMDAHAEAQQKRKAKKEKKKGEKKEKASVEVKVDRDYKRLNSYMARKEGGSKDI